MRRFLGLASLVLLLAASIVAGWVKLPYYSLGPGPANEVTPLIRVDGPQTYGSSGHLVMTTVRFEQLTPLRMLGAWLDPAVSVVKQEELYPPGLDDQKEAALAAEQMEQSKVDATSVVLRQLEGYPKERGRGALVEATFLGCSAFDRVEPGDVINEIDGTPIPNKAAASRAIGAARPGTPIVFEVESGGSRTLTRRRCAGSKDPLVGVSLVQPFPFEVSISSGEVGGPSAGLMWALGLYDLLTPVDLTDGRTIAGTGTIDLRGRVGPIGGIRDKVVAAERAGAEIFLAPAGNAKELRGVDTGDMRLISVGTFDQALARLSA
jgi:PDZ domain-containing protein